MRHMVRCVARRRQLFGAIVEYSKSTTLTATAGGVSKNVTIKVSRAGVVGSISSVKIEGNSAVPNDTPTTFKANV